MKTIKLSAKDILTLIFWSLGFRVYGSSETPNVEYSGSRSVSLFQTHEYISCNEGWYQYGHKCYKAGKDKISWQDALRYCSQLGGSLASIHSDEEQAFLIIYFLLKVKDNLWIGLHDQGSESRYAWSDETPYEYSNWDFLEPSDNMRTYYKEEDCTEMRYSNYKSQIGTWNDVKCSEKKQFLCQKDKVDQEAKVKNPVYCGKHSGWKFENSCFYYVAKPRTWKEAEEHCQNKFKGHLAAIRNKSTEKFLQYMAGHIFHYDYTWIGLKFRNNWQQVWSSGWFVSYSHYKNQEYTEGNCVVSDPTGTWITFPCMNEWPFVCEYSSISPPSIESVSKELVCPEEPKYWRDLGGKFCYYIDTESPSTWYEANLLCKRRGGILAIIRSQAELDILRQVLENTEPYVSIGLYRKLTRDGTDGGFAWVDGSPVNFTAWLEGEPNSLSEGCTELRTETMEWNDIPCEKKLGYICEVKKIPRAVRDGHQVCDEDHVNDVNQIRISKEGKCPDQWHLWFNAPGPYCYDVTVNSLKSGYEAGFECMRRGGTLAIIHSQEELDYLKSLLKPGTNYFIGLYRRAQVHEFFWDDGSSVDFTSWQSTKPGTTDEVCTELLSPRMTWNAINCRTRNEYICSAKKKLDGTIPKSSREICHERIIGEHEQSASICSSYCQKVIAAITGSVLGLVLIAFLVYLFRPFRRVPDESKRGILHRFSSLRSWQSLSNKEETDPELRSINH